jgi:hypothetical protein
MHNKWIKKMEPISNKNGLVVSSFLFPQGNENSIPIVVELNKGEWGKGGKGQGQGVMAKNLKRPNWPSLNIIFAILDLKSEYIDMHN